MSSSETAEAERHLRECDDCKKVVERLRAMLKTFAKEAEDRKNCPSPEELWGYRTRKLKDSDYKVVKEHLKTCELCKAEVNSLKGVYPFADWGVKKLFKTVSEALDRLVVREPSFALARLAEKKKEIEVKRVNIKKIRCEITGCKVTLTPQKKSLLVTLSSATKKFRSVKLTLVDELGSQRVSRFKKPGSYNIEVEGNEVEIIIESGGNPNEG